MEVEKFTFLKLYADTIQKISEGNENLAKDLCWKIIQYGIYGIEEISDDPILEALFMNIKIMVDRGKEISVQNSEKGKKGGRPKNLNKTQIKAKQKLTETQTKADESKIENKKKKIENNNITLSKDNEEEKSSYGNQEINQCLDLIKKYNGGIIDGTQTNQRRFAKHLINKLNKLDSIQQGKFTRYETLDILLKIISENKYYAGKITSPELIYNNLSLLMNVCKNDIKKTSTSSTILEVI